jgi:hypothetical protein
VPAVPLLAGLLAPAAPLQAQHEHTGAAAVADRSSTLSLRGGAHAVPLLTHVTPILQGRSLTEAYLTQPTLLGEASALRGALRARAAR